MTGVAVSYLIIIGDLMPQVIRGFDSSLERFDFMLDRHFWITAFMYGCPILHRWCCSVDHPLGLSLSPYRFFVALIP
jgi:hypothetical protein